MKVEISEIKIIEELNHFYANHDYRLSNVFIYLWESDFFCVSTSGYAIEVEVKISKSDFKADFKKTQKHHILNNGNKSQIVIPGSETNYIYENGNLKHSEYKSSEITIIPVIRPNKFFYCCPEDLINISDVPNYAGLLYFKKHEGYESGRIIQVKPAKFMHKDKIDLSKKLLDKYYYMSMDLKRDVMILSERLKSMSQFFQYKEWYERDIKIKAIERKPFFYPELF